MIHVLLMREQKKSADEGRDGDGRLLSDGEALDR